MLCSGSARWWRLSALLIASCGSISKPLLAADEERLRVFQESLDAVRRQYRIPGLSAAIVKNQQIIWEKGYGYADIANGIAAQPDTPYLIASLTKTFTSMLLMQCVERGSLTLDDPIRKYTTAIPESGVTVRHLFTHTSESKPPGESYRYNGNRFGALGAVVDSCQGTPFRLALTKSILDRLELLDTMPGKDTGNPSPALAATFSPEALAQCRLVFGWGKTKHNA
jgi:CubicO group peptidase (beta-lactamase class C family)